MSTKTKKLASILVTCAAVLTVNPSPASSQVLLVLLFGDKLSSESFQIGIKLDRAFTSQTELDGADVRSGWAFGAFGEIPLSDMWSLQPELTLTTPGGSSTFVGDPTSVPELDAMFSEVSVTRRLSYSNLQAFLKVKPGPLAIGIGPQLSYLRKAQDVYQGLVTGEDAFTLESDIVETLNRWDVGIAANLEWYVKPDRGMKSLRVHVTPFIGLLDTVADNVGNPVKNWGVSVGVGIPVGAGGDESS